MTAIMKNTSMLLVASVLVFRAVRTVAEELNVTNLKSDERVVFFTTDARRSRDGRAWTVPIHAWVHEYERSTVRKRAIAAALKQKYGLEATAKTEKNFDRRVQLFLVDNERGKRVVIRLLGKTFALPPTGANGHTRTEIELDADDVSQAARVDTLTFSAILPEGDERSFTGSVNLVDDKGLSVISDIDDTVKITHVTDRQKMFERTFLRDFEAAPGMAAFYQRLATRGAVFQFVSSSPWHLYEPLDEFLTASGFPARSMSLKLIRLKDRTIQNLFKKGTETKPEQIEPMLKAYPGRRFILIGDSGEHDPEVYAALLKKYPQQIERIFIRNVTNASPTDERYRQTFAGIEPKKWTLFTDPAKLELPE